MIRKYLHKNIVVCTTKSDTTLHLQTVNGLKTALTYAPEKQYHPDTTDKTAGITLHRTITAIQRPAYGS